MAGLITDLVEGLGAETIFYYNDAPMLSENTVIVNKFKELDISAIVLDEASLDGRAPGDVAKLVYENQLDGWGFITNAKDDVVMLIVKDSSGASQFYYYAEDPLVVSALESIGTSVDSDPGNFILENLSNFSEAVEGYAVPPAVLDSEVTETETVPPIVEEPVVTTETTTETSTVTPVVAAPGAVFTTVFSILPVLVVAAIIYRIVTKTRKTPVAPVINTSSIIDEIKKTDNIALIDEIKELEDNVSFQKSLYFNNTPNCFVAINSVKGSFERLMKTVKKSNDETEMQSLMIEYTDTFDRLNRVVGKDYWGNIVKHPKDWSDPDNRLKEVQEAVAKVEKNIYNNIQRANDNLALEFDVDLKMLQGRENKESIKEMREID